MGALDCWGKRGIFMRRIRWKKVMFSGYTNNTANLTESSYLMCTLLIVTFRFPIIVAIKLYSHEFPPGPCNIKGTENRWTKAIQLTDLYTFDVGVYHHHFLNWYGFCAHHLKIINYTKSVLMAPYKVIGLCMSKVSSNHADVYRSIWLV